MIYVNSLTGTNSEWLTLCPDMAFLPLFLAKYVCDRFHSTHPQLVPDPSGKLSHREIADLAGPCTWSRLFLSRWTPGAAPCRVPLRLSMCWLFDTLLWLDRWVLAFQWLGEMHDGCKSTCVWWWADLKIIRVFICRLILNDIWFFLYDI